MRRKGRKKRGTAKVRVKPWVSKVSKVRQLSGWREKGGEEVRVQGVLNGER